MNKKEYKQYKEEIELCFDYIQRFGIRIDVKRQDQNAKRRIVFGQCDYIIAGIDNYLAIYDEEIKKYIVAFEHYENKEIIVTRKVYDGVDYLYSSLEYLYSPFEDDKNGGISLFKNLLKKAKENQRVMKLIRQ